jgi:hypothetical protein
MTPIVYLDQQVRTACPKAQGVSIGRWGDKSTWRVTGPVTPIEQAAALAIFHAFNKAAFEASQVPVKTIEERVAALEAKLP